MQEKESQTINYHVGNSVFLFFICENKVTHTYPRFACPHSQGASSIFPQKAQKNLHSKPLTVRTFAVPLRRRQRGTGKPPVPHCRPLHFTAKTATLLLRLL